MCKTQTTLSLVLGGRKAQAHSDFDHTGCLLLCARTARLGPPTIATRALARRSRCFCSTL